MNTYLFIQEAEKYISFLKETFLAKEISRTMDDTNTIVRNCILKIGDTSFMIAQPSSDFGAMSTCFYLYVNDVDEMYQRALKNGANSVFEPADMDYGDRQGGIVDFCGNYWWISKRLDETSY